MVCIALNWQNLRTIAINISIKFQPPERIAVKINTGHALGLPGQCKAVAAQAAADVGNSQTLKSLGFVLSHHVMRRLFYANRVKPELFCMNKLAHGLAAAVGQSQNGFCRISPKLATKRIER